VGDAGVRKWPSPDDHPRTDDQKGKPADVAKLEAREAARTPNGYEEVAAVRVLASDFGSSPILVLWLLAMYGFPVVVVGLIGWAVIRDVRRARRRRQDHRRGFPVGPSRP
jgi:hypothetical protein